MGLHPTVKKWLLDNCWNESFRAYCEFNDIPGTVGGGTTRAQTSAGLDGNVVIMRVPDSLQTLEEYVHCFAGMVVKVLEVANTVVLVFDEPENLTLAKAAEQAFRDAKGLEKLPNHSNDFDGTEPEDDNYDLETLQKCTNCHNIIPHRPAKMRFFDEVMRQAFDVIMRRLVAKGLGGTRLIVDGLDPRGATRPIGEPRKTCPYGCEALVPLFTRVVPIGEGDLKLAWVEERIRELSDGGQEDILLHMSITIDTDSFPIELVEQGRRECGDKKSRVRGALVFYERAGTSLALLANKGDETKPGLLVCNFTALYHRLQDHIWNQALIDGHPPPTAEERRAAMSLVAVAWALIKCDFCMMPGLNCGLVMNTLPQIIANPSIALPAMDRAWKGTRNDLLEMEPLLRKIVKSCGYMYEEMPRAVKNTVASLKQGGPSECKDVYKKAAWTIAYWNGNEKTGDLEDFGFDTSPLPVRAGLRARLRDMLKEGGDGSPPKASQSRKRARPERSGRSYSPVFSNDFMSFAASWER